MSLDPRFDYPTHFTAISYTLMPEPPEHSIFVEDCAESDRPRQVKRETAAFAPEAQNDFCFGIIVSTEFHKAYGALPTEYRKAQKK